MKKNRKNSFAKPSKSKMCPIGYHVVRGHYRTCASGIVTWVDAHVRKNRSKKTMYLIENLLHLYWNSKKKYKKLKAIKGFKAHSEVDPIIQFWLEYWKSQGLKFPPNLTPLHIKAMIAVESSFITTARTKSPKSTATGLMQVTNTTRGILSGKSRAARNETRKHFISISRKDLDDPVTAIGAGTRWLSHKYEQTLWHRKIQFRVWAKCFAKLF